MSLDGDHEFPLAMQPNEPFASENFALMCADVGNNVSILYSIGTWHRDTSVWREVVAVALGDGTLAAAKSFGRGTHGNTVSAVFSKYEIIESEKTMRLSYDGPAHHRHLDELVSRGLVNSAGPQRLRFDVEFTASAPIWDMKGEHDDRTGVAGAMHTEQIGRCSGAIAFAGHEMRLSEVYSVRDHSRGPRNVSTYERHCWINGQFPSGRAFQTYVMDVEEVPSPAMAHAVIFDNGHAYPAKVAHIEFIGGRLDVGKLHAIVLTSSLDEMRIEVTRVASSVPIGFVEAWDSNVGALPDVPTNCRSGFVLDEAIEISWNGARGVGWSERGTRA